MGQVTHPLTRALTASYLLHHILKNSDLICARIVSLKYNPEELGLLKFMQHPLYKSVLDKILLTNQQFFAWGGFER